MSEQTFEIRCPKCQAVVPMDAAGTHSCGPPPPPERLQAVPAQISTIGTMGMKDYHRLVKANYRAAEGPRAGGAGSRLRAYLPFVLLVIGLLVGAAMAFGRL